MRIKVRIYNTVVPGNANTPVATVILSDRPPDTTMRAQSRFNLEKIETTVPEIGDQIRKVLKRPSVTVDQTDTGVVAGVRVRGVYRKSEPFGTAAYWRAALALLREAGLQYDVRDYRSMLATMEAHETRTVLILVKNAWKWLTTTLNGTFALSSDDVGRQFGFWKLQPLPLVAPTLAESALPLVLSTPLEEDIKLNLQVFPDQIWRLKLQIETGLHDQKVYVSIGDLEHTLNADTPVEFWLSPPLDQTYWLHCEWKTGEGEWQTQEIEIPALSQ